MLRFYHNYTSKSTTEIIICAFCTNVYDMLHFNTLQTFKIYCNMTGVQINVLALSIAQAIMCNFDEEEIEDISCLLTQVQCNLGILRRKKNNTVK